MNVRKLGERKVTLFAPPEETEPRVSLETLKERLEELLRSAAIDGYHITPGLSGNDQIDVTPEGADNRFVVVSFRLWQSMVERLALSSNSGALQAMSKLDIALKQMAVISEKMLAKKKPKTASAGEFAPLVSKGIAAIRRAAGKKV